MRGFRSFWVSRPSNRGLETREVVPPSTGPADPRGDAAVSHQRANPATPTTAHLLLWGFSWDNRQPRPIGLQQSYSPRGRPEGPSLKSGKSSTGGRLPEAGPWWLNPRASVWKIHPRLAGPSGESSLINLIPPTTVARNTKTHLRTLMIPLNLLMGLSQVLPCLPWLPAPPVPLPRHPSDRLGVFHSAPLSLST